MELALPLTNARAQLCLILADLNPNIDRELAWPRAAEDFLRRMNKLGVQVTVVGPRPPNKFGSKKTIRFLDKHEVISFKLLEASRSHRIECRILNRRTKAWIRLRAEACVTFGLNGVWPKVYEGWMSPGVLSINALSRWLGEHKWLPGNDFLFLGSSNQVFRLGCALLDRGAKSCTIVEPGSDHRGWRAYKDRFATKGGRVLLNHRIQRVVPTPNHALQVFLVNEQGTMIAPADTVVLSFMNDEALNDPEQRKNGLYYIQRRSSPWESLRDEEQWLERLDWQEVYWRLLKLLGTTDHAARDGALKSLRGERRALLAYRKSGGEGSVEKRPRWRSLGYSGKILDRSTLSAVLSSPSVPKSFAHPKPMASLECFEDLPCRACVDVCPENAIEKKNLTDWPKLIEDKCTGCGACVAACPPGAAVMARESPKHQKARYFLPDDTRELWKEGRALQLLNRKGDVLGSGRVVGSFSYEGAAHRVLEIESTPVHLWEARDFRLQKGDFAEETLSTAPSLVSLKREWVLINGVSRLCPIDVPVTVALWQLGLRRFEDGLFCHDGGCRLCSVMIDGRPALACKTLVSQGQDIRFEAPTAGSALNQCVVCPCKEVTQEQYQSATAEGASKSLARELTGFSQGLCHGRWCLSRDGMIEGDKQRPVFHGYEASPWRDLWASDVIDADPDSND